MKTLYYLILFLLFLSSCDKFDWHNPYDPECPKELFTPSSPGATMEGNSVKLTWSQQNDDISGFALYRSSEGESITNLTQTQKSITQYIDASITPGKKYTYYVLAVAGTNKSDTIKAEITPVFPVTVSSSVVSNIGSDSAFVDAEILNGGGGQVDDRGVCWSTTTNPTVNNNKVSSGTGIGKFTSKLRELQSGQTYYVRAYGQNTRGVSYGAETSFTTIGSPILITNAVTAVTSTSAISGGSISSDGGAPITARGVCWSKSPDPTINDTKTIDGTGTGTGSFESKITALEPGTLYYVRAYAQNSVGISYGAQLSFNTSIAIPVLTTTSVSLLTSTTAISGGFISSDGGAPVSARGVCWSTTTLPTINSSKTIDGTGTGTYSSQVVGLKASTTYYLRAYATNSFTTVYGEQLTFTTPSGPLFTNGTGVTDVEGNTYKTVIIGTQEWMEENLKVTKFNDGSSIPYIIPLSEWSTASTPALCDWNHDIANGQTFGKLYNYYAIVDTRKLCPVGWRMPTSNDFITLESYIGAPEAGKLMKSAIGWNFWPDPLQGNGNNLSGFNGLAGGRRGGDDFQDYRSIAYWWTTSEFSTSTAISFSLSRENYILARVLLNKVNGLSVRCIKN